MWMCAKTENKDSSQSVTGDIDRIDDENYDWEDCGWIERKEIVQRSIIRVKHFLKKEEPMMLDNTCET